MGRGKRRRRFNALSGGALEAGFGMMSADGEQALADLVNRLDLSLEPDVDLLELRTEIEQGLALIASYYPEAQSEQIRRLVFSHIRSLLTELGIGESSDELL